MSPGADLSAATLEALQDLEFAAVLDQVAGHATGPLGAERVRCRRPSTDLHEIRHQLALVDEAAGLIRTHQGITPEPVPDLARVLPKLAIEGSVLEIGEMRAVGRSVTASRLVVGELRRVARDAPGLAALEQPLPSRTIERRLEASFDADGYLLDGASPALARARKEVRAARERLIHRLEALLRASGGEADGEVTVRNGRYVIPVRRDSRQRPGGIVHDESASGGTLFVEPAEAIELGNALRAAEAEEEREVLRVLRELTEMIRPEREVIAAAHAMCVRVDEIVACGRYAVAVEGSVPAISESGELVIRFGRHPLLIGAGVVPFDLELNPGERTVLISGPNTGGKTVLLKAVGLISALAQSGIIPPVGPGTRLPVFESFFADIGDRQSIAASLSTFSAHVQRLRRILQEADARSLVLLDEVGSGTDPLEGAALAGAALVSLTERGAVTLASTHLGTLKQLAASGEGLVNASLEFDAATLSPTYRFQKGVPGRSYGLAIARRLGIPETVLEAATARVPDSERHIDAVLAELEKRERELREREASHDARASGLEALAARLTAEAEAQAAREAELARREREVERSGRREARRYLLEARRRVEQAITTVQQAVAVEAASRDARRMVEQGIQEESAALEEVERPAPSAAPGTPIRPGDRVRVGQGSTGEVIEIRPDGRLVVMVGAIRMVVDAASVGPAPAGERRSRPAAPAVPVEPPTDAAPTEVDLRGMTGDEAEAATLAAIDAAVLADRPSLRIIHGMGTGVVRERVRRVASGDRRVARFGFAPANQGGTGVTIVEFTA